MDEKAVAWISMHKVQCVSMDRWQGGIHCSPGHCVRGALTSPRIRYSDDELDEIYFMMKRLSVWKSLKVSCWCVQRKKVCSEKPKHFWAKIGQNWLNLFIRIEISWGFAEKIIKIRPTVAELSVKNHFSIVEPILEFAAKHQWGQGYTPPTVNLS